MSEEQPHQYEGPEHEAYPITPPPPARPRGFGWITTVISWVVILALVVLVVWGQTRRENRSAEGESKLDYTVFELQARNILGANELLPGYSKDFYQQAKPLNRGPLGERLRFIVIAGDLAGPGEARKKLGQIRDQLKEWKVKPANEQARLLNALDALYRDYANLHFDAPSVSKSERKLIVQELGWLGELALAPKGVSSGIVPAVGGVLAGATVPKIVAPATPEKRTELLEPAMRTFITFMVAILVAGMLGFLGFAGLVLFVVMIFSGKIKAGVECGITYGNVYAETFALWMIVFFGLSLAAHFVPEEVAGELTPAAAAMLLSLIALLWPVLRGVPWRQVRQDIGWTAGRQPLLEPIIGIGSYAMSLPLLVCGIALTALLMWIQGMFDVPGSASNPFAPGGYPAHPIVEKLAHGDLLEKFKIIFLASIVAPIVEETMFRGVLYRHMREGTCRLGRVMSIFLSGTIVSFVFAIIHPQGWVAVPALMSLAYGFTIAREWRGTLIPSMVAHGLSNGLVTMMVIFAFG